MAAKGNVCVPIQHTFDERDLLLTELQQRMTRAVLESPHYEQSLHSPHELYRTLANFFEAQQAEAEKARQIALSATDLRRVWTYCIGVVHQEQEKKTRSSKSTAAVSSEEAREELQQLVRHGPSVFLEALQQHAPYTAEGQQQISLFSLLRPAMSCILDLCYVVECRLHGPASPSAGASRLSVLHLGVACASLVSTLDRVQAVRVTAQVADEVWESHRDTFAGTAKRAGQHCSHFFHTVVFFLAGVWYVWGVLDVDHTAPLRIRAESLVRDAAAAVSSGDLPPVSSFFNTWLQGSLRGNGGAVHQQLCVEPMRTSTRHSMHDAAVAEAAIHQEAVVNDRAQTPHGEEDFWLRLAS